MDLLFCVLLTVGRRCHDSTLCSCRRFKKHSNGEPLVLKIGADFVKTKHNAYSYIMHCSEVMRAGKDEQFYNATDYYLTLLMIVKTLVVISAYIRIWILDEIQFILKPLCKT